MVTMLVIVSLDLVSKQFSIIPLFDSVNGVDSSSIQLHVISGCLSLSHYNSSQGSEDVWMLKQPPPQQPGGSGSGSGVWDNYSWQKLFSIDSTINLLTVLDDCKCLVKYRGYNNVEEELVILDPLGSTQNAPVKIQANTDLCFLMIFCWKYVESLVSPFGMYT